ncbi:hypothetical protein AC579_8537 [Pseudocercospora musae]|uniref:Major facilitator superfamily (MFS) profile domain-containing protein n=1 Tax=Pseudocercospora musae TaxID=113226 RepID=A0A139HCU0_9PEZI|nr:hypothetical protein AC579_8537 [Pseudocercospora musae]
MAAASSEPSRDSDNEEELVHKDMQRGVEALAQVWPKVWIIYFIDALGGPVGWTLVTSDFQLHGLTAIKTVVPSLVGGLFRLPLAKIIDIWGRPEGLALMVLFMTLGSIMMAATDSVQMYCAAEVFSVTGGNGRNYILSVLLADTSQLKNRSLILAYIASPYIITTFTYGYFAESMLNGPGWRWAFGIFAILHPVLNAPLFLLLVFNQNKALKMGLVPVREIGRSTMQSIKYYLVEFDIFGLFLIVSGPAIFLLPFSLDSYQGATLEEQWSSALVVSMIVIGLVFIIAFVVWEAKFTPVTFVPYHLLRDPTVVGAFILAAVLFVEFYIWNPYFTSFLQVVPNLDLVRVGYISGIYSMGSCFWSFGVGAITRYTGDYKYQTLLFGMPITILGVSLMIIFRQPDVNIGYIVMCHLFIAFGGGALVVGQQVAIMAVTTHQYVAVVLAILAVASSIGGAIGSTIAGAERSLLISLDFFPRRLWPTQRPLQEISPLSSATLLVTAIQHSCGNSQRYMLIAATAIAALGFPDVAIWKNIDVRQRKQVKGRVF